MYTKDERQQLRDDGAAAHEDASSMEISAAIACPSWTTRILEGISVIVIVLAAVLTGVLAAATLLFTVASDYDQSFFTVSLAQAPFIVVGVVVAAIVIGAASLFTVKYPLRKTPHFARNLAIAVFAYALALSIVWLFAADTEPAWDSAEIYYSAHQLALYLHGDSSANMAPFEPGGYMYLYPYQTPFMLVLMVFGDIIGWRNVEIPYGCVNALANGLSMAFTVMLVDWMYASRKATTIAAILSALFFPLILYTTFIYGNNLALALVIASFYMFVRSARPRGDTDQRATHPVALMVGSAISMTLAVAVKSTMQIAMIALALVGVVFFLLDSSRRSWASAAVKAALAAAPIVCSKLLVGAMVAMVAFSTGTSIEAGGRPSSTWFVMGLGGEVERLAAITGDEAIAENTNMPGYFRGYPVVDPSEDGFSTYEEMNRHWIKERLKHYAADPELAVEFFGKKLAIEWTEPVFEGFTLSNWDREALPAKITAGRDYTPLGEEVYYGATHDAICVVSDVEQTMLALGAFVAFAALLRRRNRMDGRFSPADLLPAVFILGGFVLYLAWETKSQYTMSFYFAMIPYAAQGWRLFADGVQYLWAIRFRGERRRSGVHAKSSLRHVR